jgi:hypothetical protein
MNIFERILMNVKFLIQLNKRNLQIENGGFMSEQLQEGKLSRLGGDLLFLLTHSKIPKLYSHLEHHPIVGWRMLPHATFSGDHRVNTPTIRHGTKPLPDEPVRELMNLGILSGSWNGVLSVTEKGFGKAEELRQQMAVTSE